MKNSAWIDVKDRVPESGQEVLIYYFDSGFDIHQMSIVTYFKRDAVMDTAIPNKYDMPEKNLLDALFNPNNEMKASQDGFYIYDSAGSEEARFRKHADVITHWQPLPEPPYMIAEEPFMKVKERIKNELALHKQFIVDLIKCHCDDICDYCKHYIKCEGEDCVYFISGTGDAEGKYPDFKWTCEDFNYGTCQMLESTPCNGCFDNKYKGFDWKGLGGDGHD